MVKDGDLANNYNYFSTVLSSFMRRIRNQPPKVASCSSLSEESGFSGFWERTIFLCSSIYRATKVELCRTV
jgi:hypothetical protein